ncbi:myomegalin-like isoform X3 [Leuresthes tenuis]|uniref:myomegalin-like isoform X3 n=1 Tax=Leuresthes tenuis TaxID=355514 RepID=UPI003B50A300
MLDLKMKETCRICGRELCGNQRRWIFHPTAKLNLQVLLSHALGQELTRDGKGEFACSKCTFMLDRMYRFDTVIARVEALSIERLQRLLQEKHRLRQCIGGLYRKTNSEEGAGILTGINEEPGDGMVDISGLTHARYCALLQEDLVYSLYESWADDGLDCHHQHHPQCSAGPGSEATAAASHRCVHSTPRRCRGCSYWRVADSDYEAVCKVPRKLARSISCGPSTRSSASVIGGSVTGGGGQPEKKHVEDSEEAPSSQTLVPGSQDLSRMSDSDRTLAGRVSSSPSVASLETAEEYAHPGTIMDGLLRSPREAIEDNFSDSLSEEHMGASHGQASPAPSLSLTLCLLQSYVAYRPVRRTKGSKLPVLLRRSSTNECTRPPMGMSYGTPEEEKDSHMPTPELDTPLIRLGFGEDQELNLANMDDLLEDLYNEYPPPRPHQNLVEEQQSQLNQYECAAGQCVSELQKAQLQVQSLQAKIHESEANNMKLQEKLSEMECELRSLRQATQSQERTIQGLTESMTTKDSEAQELYQLIEGQNTTLCKLQELAHVSQLTQSKVPGGVSESLTLSQLQSELVGVQSSLFSLGLELEASQRSLSQSQRQGDDLMRFKDRLNSDLQEALQHREVTEKHNQDLRSALQKLRSELQAKEASLKENETEKHTAIQEKDRSIAQLKCSLQDKEQQLQEYSEMLESTGNSKHRDALLEKLRERIKERDRALERSIDEKFRCLEERDGQVRTLQLALREKERDLERLRCILTNNEETITSLDALMRGKELELEQAAEAYRNLQWLKQQSEERERNTLREKDTIINQLQAALQTRSQETQDLTAALVARAHAGPTDVVEELKAQLGLKEKLFQELLSDRSRQTNEHQAQVQDLLNTLSSKDQYLQDYSYRLSLVVSERTGQLQELRRQLTQTEQELCELRRDKEREMGGETEHLRVLLKEKEAFIKELIQAQEETVQPFSKESESEMKALKDEMQLVLKKEMEAQKELSALRLSLARHQSEGVVTKDSPDHQCVLEQLVTEYNKLNDALRVEKRLYQNMTHIHNSDRKSEKIQALHTELDSVQALRGQLEEVLARTSNMALVLERAAKRQPDFGELSTEEEEEEGDDEDGSSDEFTDSIEEDDNNVSSRSLNSVQACVKAQRSECVTAELIGGVFPQNADIKQLEEAKRALEVELEEIKSQLEKDGYTSMVEMRSALQRLQQENQALTERQGWAGATGLRTKGKKNLNQEEEGSEGADEDLETSPVLSGKRGPPSFSLSNESGKRHCLRPRSLDLSSRHTKTDVGPAGGRSEVGLLWQDIEKGLREQAACLRSDLVLSQKENRELQERLMVSEATVQAQAEQLKDYRDLLTETSVQQASKQVQVDLQDLGYETCGRSENEAEREDTSSPEFDDLEMCTALSHHQDSEGVGSGWYPGNCSHNRGAYETQDESASLQHLVQDLRSQLTRCHKVIRGLQLRVRSLSATSDYASSLERTPRKVNWAFETSPAPSGAEEDEGWMSDTQGMRSSSRPSRELQELMERVATLENQLKGSKMEGKEEGKCATWPGKYNSLIQAQARELSHLRQRMREGQGVCHILTQHLGDTTKGFEELLRANDIDYYMGQSFREQLAQSTALAQRVIIKISGRERAESHDDKTGHELLALSKLQQRPETPSSCHALSETTDQSDRTSLVSDEYQTNEDLELCSDLDAREFQEDHRLRQQRHMTESDVRSSLPPPHGFLKSSSSCPNMLCSATVGLTSQSARALVSVPVSSSLSVPSGPDVWGYEVSSDPRPRALSVIAVRPELDSLYKQMSEHNRVYGVAQEKTPFSLSPSAHNQHDLSSYSQLSHHAFQQYQLGGIPEDHSMKSDSGLVTGRPLWDVENFVQPFGSYSGNQPGSSQAGVNLIEEHLREVRNLRQRLEESIRTNERLRQQLEEKVASAGRDGGAPTNIYIQGLDTVTQLSNEIRVLKEENLGLQSRLQASTDTNEEMVQLREAVFTARARLKQAELEAEQWKEELRRLQAHSQEQGQQIHTLRQERQAGQEKSNRLQHEVSLLQQQLCESRDLIHSLQSELHVYDRVCSSAKANKGYLCEVAGLPVELSELLAEVRSLRAQLQSSVQENSALKQLELHKQLEQKLGVASPRTPSLSALTASPQRENFYRRQLLHDPAPSPPVRDIGLFNCGSPGPPYSDLEDSHSTANADPLDPHSELEGEAPDGSFANRNGRHAIGHVDDFSALQQQVLEGRSLIQRMEATLQACLTPPLLEGNQKDGSDLVLDYGCVKSLLSNTKTLRQILEEAMSLLKMFWRAALPSTDPPIQNLKKEQCMQEEILSLKLRISEQEEVLKGTIQRLRSTSRTKESMEHFIVNQLSRTRDVLRKARTNLEKNELRLSSLSSSSSSPYAAEDPGGAARELPTDRSVLKMSCASGVAAMAANQRTATRKRSSQCLL